MQVVKLYKIRICNKCKLEKDDKLFYRHHSITPDGIRKYCNDCRNEYRRKAHKLNPEIKRKQAINFFMKNKDKINKKAQNDRKKYPERYKGYSLKLNYDITFEEFKSMCEIQKNVCAICGLLETSKEKNKKLRYLSVDHCHISNKIRGLLCWMCNAGIGRFKDNPELLRKAAIYLESNK